MGARLIRWVVFGLAVCLLFAGVAHAQRGEERIAEVLAGFCDETAREKLDETYPRLEGLTPDEIRQFFAAMAESQGRPVREVSDDEAREAINGMVADWRAISRVLLSYCRLLASNALPEHGLALPEHGEFMVKGYFRTPPEMREIYDSAFEPSLCERPFDLIMRVSGDGDESPHDLISIAYIFCESSDEFQLIGAYRKSGEAENPWERFDSLR